MALIVSIAVTFGKIQYEFGNRVILKVLKKLVIAVTNPFICYLIAEVNYVKLLPITKLILIGIKFEIPREVSYTYDS